MTDSRASIGKVKKLLAKRKWNWSGKKQRNISADYHASISFETRFAHTSPPYLQSLAHEALIQEITPLPSFSIPSFLWISIACILGCLSSLSQVPRDGNCYYVFLCKSKAMSVRTNQNAGCDLENKPLSKPGSWISTQTKSRLSIRQVSQQGWHGSWTSKVGWGLCIQWRVRPDEIQIFVLNLVSLKWGGGCREKIYWRVLLGNTPLRK
jgi:hypothetical protein